jgi:hypothetical protein
MLMTLAGFAKISFAWVCIRLNQVRFRERNVVVCRLTRKHLGNRTLALERKPLSIRSLVTTRREA